MRSVSSKNINNSTTENKDEVKEAEKEKMMTKINLKREKDRMRVARMERLELRRKEWETRNVCNSIMKELVDEMEPFEMKDWMKEIDELIETLEMDNERFAMSTKVMEEEEEWLKDVANRTMEP